MHHTHHKYGCLKLLTVLSSDGDIKLYKKYTILLCLEYKNE